jgi:hypothetical protein
MNDNQREMVLDHRYLNLPVKSGAPKRNVNISVDGVMRRRFEIELAEDQPDFWAFVDMSGWAGRTAVERGDVVRDIALLLRERREEASAIVVEETGKPLELALGETDAAVEMGLFVAGEGRRSYGRTLTASMPHRTVLTLRQLHPTAEQRAAKIGFGAVELGHQTMNKLARHLGVS